jgi:glycosyltransferase involved in cell wall biosynthesis
VVRREGGTGYLLFVGSLTEGKNLQGAVDALSLLRSRYDVRLVVVGGVGRGLASGSIRIPESCSDRVEFLGQAEDVGRLVDLYRRAICLVFPSRYESSGLPPTEAMACGCPVVATDLPALRERCGDAALYCDAEAPRTIAACVLQVIEEEGRAETLRQAGTRRAAELSWEENVRRSLEVMRKLAGEQVR